MGSSMRLPRDGVQKHSCYNNDYKQFREVGSVTLRPRVPSRKTASKAIGVLLAIAAVVTGVKADLIPGLGQVRDALPLVSAAPFAATASLSISPSSAVPNESIVLFGTNFSAASVSGGTGPGGTHQITGTGGSKITLGGTALESPYVSYPIPLDSGGTWVAEVVIPGKSGAAALTSGSLQVVATDSIGASASASVSMRSRKITLAPKEGRVGSEIEVKGVGFHARNGTSPDQFSVNIDYNGKFRITVTPDASGAFETKVTAPFEALIPSTNTVKATVVGTAAAASAEHKVPAATVSISPGEGPSGIIFTVNGANFRPFRLVSDITIGVPSVLSSSLSTDADGSFTFSGVVPQLPAGTKVVSITVGQVRAFVSFKVTEPDVPPTPIRTPTPTPRPTSTPSPPADPYVGLAPLIEAGNLVRAWHFDPSAQNDPPDFGWSLFDPRTVFASANTVREIRSGQFYWISVRNNQTVTLNGKERVLYSGWNPVTW